MPNSFNDAEKNYEEGFATFWMPNGEVRHIRTKYAFDFINEATSTPREQWSKGAVTVATAVKSRGIGKMLELLHGLIDPLPALGAKCFTTVSKEPNFEEHLASLHGIPASETGE
jgi:hypothetical protein